MDAIADLHGFRRHSGDPTFPPTLAAKLPPQWLAHGHGLGKGFDALSSAIAGGQDISGSLLQLGDIMRSCLGCHTTYRVVDAQ